MSTPPSTAAPSGPPAGRPGARVVGVTVVCVLAGLLFGTSAALARTSPPATGARDLVSLITARDQQVRSLTERAEELRAEVDALEAAIDDGETRRTLQQADRLAPTVGTAPVSGPAVEVTLDDAGYTLDTVPEGFSVDDVVVHQQDLQAVVNALWAGGAEAIMVQDQRIVSTSSIQCVGNTLYLQGRVYSPPYTVTAVGDQDAMLAALEADPVLENYRAWAEAIGLGYAVRDLPNADLPGFAGGVRPQYASVAELPDSAPEPTPGG